VREIIFVRRKSTFVVALVLAALGLAGVASTASATFHLIKVREVRPGTAAAPDSGYVELQMYFSFQRFVSNGQLRIYNANGTTASTFQPPSDVANGESQRTVLIADSAFGTAFPSVTPDFTDSSLNLSAAAGAVCWPVNSSPIDCASWGAFTGNASLPSSAGSPVQGTGTAGAIADGKAVIRSIAPGCPTLLEAGDDTNNSATDFSQVNPNPRPNSSAIVETACGGTVMPPPSYPATSYPTTGYPKKKKCKKHKKPSGAYSAKKKCKKKRK
jgi:hypothetical protein